ncbi:MAG: type II toxin-antitoxin system VapC family toxin [Lautropia sp.]|nr:type II toxin-antitoxin system VapC family toxin [Lautropia sp.]
MMKITADTNIILRYLLADDPVQTESGRSLIKEAEQVVIPLPVLYEVTWVLARGYKLDSHDIADALQALVASHKVQVMQSAVNAGLSLLRAGGDFADGAIAQEGLTMGADLFATFDRKAAKLL